MAPFSKLEYYKPMTRMSKQGSLRAISRRRPRPPSSKTGPKIDKLQFGYKPHENAMDSESAAARFIPKMSSKQ
jgi:hypothetical protein